MKKLMAILLSGFMITGALSGCTGSGSSTKLDTSGEYVATAGEIKIPKEAFQYVMHSYKTNQENTLLQFGIPAEQVADYWNTELEDGTKMIDGLKKSSLSSTEEFFAIVELAKAKGVKVDQNAFKELQAQIDAQLTALSADGANGEETFKKQTGVTASEMKGMAELILHVQAYQEGVRDETKASAEAVRAHYDENIDSYNQVTVQHILIEVTDEMTEDEKVAAKASADDVLEKVKAGGDMKELAATYSSDAGSKDNSGEYTFGRGEMMAEFEDWAFAAKEGDTGVVETSYGYHVMKYISGGITPFETASLDIQAELDEAEATDAINAAIAELGLVWETNEDVYNSVTIES